MEFWRTLFGHRGSLYPSQQVSPSLPPTPYVPPAAPPLPVFQTLTFSSTSFTTVAPSIGTINNATVGSVIVAVGLPSGLTINSLARTWAWSGSGLSGSGSFSLYENIPGSAGNPKLSPISYVIIPGVTFDNRFGTDIPTATATGWFTWGLKPSRRQIFAGTGGNDANSGLTHALRKLTFDAAVTTFKSGYVAGDQLLLAEGSTFTDSGFGTNGDFTSIGGSGVDYPLLVASYDPADPTNAAKYGRALGANKPVINIPASPSMAVNGSSGTNYYAWAGLEFNGQDAAGANIGFFGLHNGIVVQNCHSPTCRIILPGGGSTVINVSKSSGHSAWASDYNSSCVFSAATDSQIMEDCVWVRGGWRHGANRNDTAANGGAGVFGHGDYYTSDNTNGIRRRVFYSDSAADGRNYRGFLTDASCLISLDDPYSGIMCGYSSAYTDAPLGTKVIASDWSTLGGARINDSVPNNGAGINSGNSQSGTILSNAAFSDSPRYGVDAIVLFASHAEDALQIPQFLALDNIRAYNYADGVSVSASGTATTGQIHVTVTNTKSNTLLTGTGNTTWGGSPPANYTRAYFLTQMGFSGATYNEQKAAALNWLLEYPHLNWYQPWVTLHLQALGLNPTSFTATTAPPSTSGLTAPRVIYGTSFSALAWVGATTFANGTPSSGSITGVPAGWTLWGTSLPTGLTINSRARTWAWDGTNTATTGTLVLNTAMPGGTPYTQNVSYTITGGATGYRAFKLASTASMGALAGVSVAEWQIATSSGGASVSGSATASATSFFGAGFEASKANDADTSTFWNSDFSGTWPQNLILDFGATSANWKVPFESRIIPRAGGNNQQAPGDYIIYTTTDDPAASPTWTARITKTGVTYDTSQTPHTDLF